MPEQLQVVMNNLLCGDPYLCNRGKVKAGKKCKNVHFCNFLVRKRPKYPSKMKKFSSKLQRFPSKSEIFPGMGFQNSTFISCMGKVYLISSNK